MNILSISPFPLFPPKDGASIGIYFRLKMLGELGHKVYSFYPAPIDSFTGGKVLLKTEADGLDGAFGFRDKKFFKNALHPSIPFYCGRNSLDTGELDALKKFILDKKIGFVFIESTFSGEIYYRIKPVLDENKIPRAFFSHNIDYRDFFNLFKDASNFFWKMYYLWESFKLYRYERRLFREFKLIFSVSFDETPVIAKASHGAEAVWVPSIIPVKNAEMSPAEKKSFQELETSTKGKKVILFTGIMDKSSNIRAARWFAKRVMPVLEKTVPNAEFWIVGKKPGEPVHSLAKPNIRVIADVPEIKPYFHRADLVVVPIFNNAGIKIKLIEALRFGKKIVSTTAGLYGSGLSDLIPAADNPRGFAARCADVLDGKVDFQTVLEKFNQIFDNRKIIADMDRKIKSVRE
ncbi:MAG: hypothetical protein A2Y33_07160 [Spirochaetes bacterium GWF1_51_8]|nr:MAG: hypothetical protein A2Y33_07160 [Spirochaetes bacterium GWF1_51_8]